MKTVNKTKTSVKFGPHYIKKPTPGGLDKSVKIITVVLSVFIAWMNTNSMIGDEAQHVINSIGGLLLSLGNALAPMFGIDIKESTKIPVSQVDVMERRA